MVNIAIWNHHRQRDKKKKKKSQKIQDKCKMAEAAYTDTNLSSFDQDKNTVFLENPELNELGIWSSF